MKLKWPWTPALLVLLIGCCYFLTGCRPAEDSRPPGKLPGQSSLETVTPEPLVLMVVDAAGDQIGNAIARQWTAEMGGVIQVLSLAPRQFAAEDYQLPAEVDVLIYPVTLLGELESRRRLLELSRKVWSADEFNRTELLPIYRSKLVRHANRNWGIPLGGPQFALMYDREWLQQQGGRIPDLWEDWLVHLQQAGSTEQEVADRRPIFQMPLAEGWAAQMFLLRVGSMIRSRGRLSTVFDRSTMQPLLESTPFQKGLEDLKQLLQDDLTQLELTPADVFRNVLTGQARSGITWLHPMLESQQASNDRDLPGVNIGFGSLPGQSHWFDSATERWIRRSPDDSLRSDLIGFAGRLASVSSSSRVSDQGFEFLAWLGNKTTALKTIAGDPYFGPFRASQLGNPTRWSGEGVSEQAAQEYADLILGIQEQDISFMFPRIPGRDRYLAALDQKIRSCLRGELDAATALKNAARDWEEITESIGRNRLIQELRKDAGL
jgi:multiple sugar transport system substrate-binding protein